MRRIIGFISLGLLLLALGTDLSDRFFALPCIHHAPTGITFHVRHGYVSVEPLLDESRDVLVQEGRRRVTIGTGSSSFRFGGIRFPLLFFEVIFATLTAWLLLAPRWLRTTRRRDGLCESCAYPLRGLSGRVCPECGVSFSTRAESHEDTPPPRDKRFRSVALPTLILCLFVGSFHTLLSIGRPSLWESIISLRPNPNAFMLKTGQVATIRKDGSVATIEISEMHNYVCIYRARFWADEDTASERDPDEENIGSVSEPAGKTTIKIGPWSFSWSMGDDTQHWIYRPDESFAVSIGEE